MRKGRGLVEKKIYDELMKVPGAWQLLLDNTTNFRTNNKTGKLCAEIHEDAWQEVKEMVAKWKRFKKGKPQEPVRRESTFPHPGLDRTKKPRGNGQGGHSAPTPKKEKANIQKQERIKKLRNLKPGDKEFAYKNVGFGLTSYERGSSVIEIKNGKLFTETFDSIGMEWDGETWKFDGGVGMVTYIVLMEEVPEGGFEQ